MLYADEQIASMSSNSMKCGDPDIRHYGLMSSISMIYNNYVNEVENNICKDYATRNGYPTDRNDPKFDDMMFYGILMDDPSDILDDDIRCRLETLKAYKEKCETAMKEGRDEDFTAEVKNIMEYYSAEIY